MSNATDNLIEAENIIHAAFSKTNAPGREKLLNICLWLLGFNGTEKEFKIKCYLASSDKNVCFCIDRGDDCKLCKPESTKVFTWFLRISKIEPSFVFRPIGIEPNASYLKLDRKNTKNIKICSEEAKKLDIEILKKHIFDSYGFQLKKLGLVSEVLTTNNTQQQRYGQIEVGSHLPTKEDFESTYRILTRLGEAISIDSVLDRMETNAKKKGLALKNNWRMITEKSIEVWSTKRRGNA